VFFILSQAVNKRKPISAQRQWKKEKQQNIRLHKLFHATAFYNFFEKVIHILHRFFHRRKWENPLKSKDFPGVLLFFDGS